MVVEEAPHALLGRKPPVTPSPAALVVEDDEPLAEIVALALEDAGYRATVVHDGAEALHVARSQRFGLIVLDVLLPSLDGFEVCRHLRSGSAVPIIMITARSDTADIIAGLDHGADDYLAKPFELSELLARVRAVERRGLHPPGPTVVVRDLEISLPTVEVRKRGQLVQLTSTEFRLLVTFAQAPRQVFTREALLKQVWGYEFLGDSGMVTMAVKRLREKVEDDPSAPTLIETVRGFGYRFAP
jgi:DNA-binding response OmpR family regulator